MMKRLAFITLTFLNYCLAAQGFSVTYGFQDVSTSTGMTDPSPGPTVQGLGFGSFSAHGTTANSSASGRFSFTGWPAGAVNGSDDYSQFSGALSPTVYYEVTITVDPGYTLSLNSASLAVRRTGTGIRQYSVRSGIDNYINNLAASTGTSSKLSALPDNSFFWNYDSVSTSNDQRGSTVTFGTEFKTITQSVTFRVYAWNAESAGGSFSIDNVSFMGTVKDSLSATLGLSNEMQAAELPLLYPNPSTTGEIYLTRLAPGSSIQLYSPEGLTLMKRRIEGREGLLDLRELKSGPYFLEIRSGSGSFHRKIVLCR